MKSLPLLVECEWLDKHLYDRDLRVLECTVFLSAGEEGLWIESGYESWKEEHIPTSSFVDVIEELSEQRTELPFMLPSAEQFSKVMSQYGVDEGSHVVLYDRAGTVWAARVWWMLRVFGFEQVSILNGGWQQWKQRGYPLTQEITECPETVFQAEFCPQYLATTQDVLFALGNDSTCFINSLRTENFHAARIPGSINVPYVELLDSETGAFLALTQLRNKFHNYEGAVICYCGSGITACVDAFVLSLLGWKDVAVYDGSMSEWTAGGTLPIERES